MSKVVVNVEYMEFVLKFLNLFGLVNLRDKRLYPNQDVMNASSELTKFMMGLGNTRIKAAISNMKRLRELGIETLTLSSDPSVYAKHHSIYVTWDKKRNKYMDIEKIFSDVFEEYKIGEFCTDRDLDLIPIFNKKPTWLIARQFDYNRKPYVYMYADKLDFDASMLPSKSQLRYNCLSSKIKMKTKIK
jgi:hypothetical protein